MVCDTELRKFSIIIMLSIANSGAELYCYTFVERIAYADVCTRLKYVGQQCTEGESVYKFFQSPPNHHAWQLFDNYKKAQEYVNLILYFIYCIVWHITLQRSIVFILLLCPLLTVMSLCLQIGFVVWEAFCFLQRGAGFLFSFPRIALQSTFPVIDVWLGWYIDSLTQWKIGISWMPRYRYQWLVALLSLTTDAMLLNVIL